MTIEMHIENSVCIYIYLYIYVYIYYCLFIYLCKYMCGPPVCCTHRSWKRGWIPGTGVNSSWEPSLQQEQQELLAPEIPV